MHARVIVTATATVAAALLSGCASPGTVGGSTLPTRIDTGTSTAVSATSFDPAGWQRLPDKPVPDTTPLDLDGKAFGPLPRPGMRVRQDLSAGLTYDCAAGPLVRGATELGLLTVGHCDKRPGADVFTYADAAETVPIELGHYVHGDRFGGTLLQLDPGVTADPIATHWGPYRAAGVIPADQVPAALPTGSPICVLTSPRCGAVRRDAVGEHRASLGHIPRLRPGPR